MRVLILAGVFMWGVVSAAASPVAAQAPPSPTPVRTSVPGHPLRLVFGPTPATETSFAGPDTAGLTSLAGAEAVRREFGNLVPTAVPGFVLTFAGADGGRGRFQATVDFVSTDGSKNFRLRAWTKTGEFIYAAPADSPVTDVQQTMVGGLYALSLMPTAAVSGGIGPRTIFLTDDKDIWLIEPNGYTVNAEAVELAALIAGIIRSPDVPATGNTKPRPAGTGLPLTLLGAAMALSGVALFACEQLRRRRDQS